MFPHYDKLFDLQENETIFEDICNKLLNHSFQSPWELCFNDVCTEAIDCIVREFKFAELNISQVSKEKNILGDNFLIPNTPQTNRNEAIKMDIDKEKFLQLKTSLLSAKENYQVENIKDIYLVNSLSLSQIPAFCEFLSNAISNEEAVTLFLSAILSLEKPLSITVAALLIHHLIFPKIDNFHASNCKNFSLSILNFFHSYPKAVIDEIIVPCLKKTYLEPPLQTFLLKFKSEIPMEYIAYFIRNIIDTTSPSEDTFLFIQCLIEKKIAYDVNLHDTIALTLENWSSAYSTNKKFTKVLICILSTYGNQLTQQQIKIYSDVIQANKTIMKKAAENVLKKLNG